MNVPLIDPWFEAEFYGTVEENDRSYRLQGDRIEGAQGVWLYCPCSFGGTSAHGLIIPFANPRNAPQLPANHGPLQKGNYKGPRPRWQLASGTGLHDLSIAPSVDVGDPSCWHGYIQGGLVTAVRDDRAPTYVLNHPLRGPPPAGVIADKCRACGYVEPSGGYAPALVSGTAEYGGLCVVCTRKLYQEDARLITLDGKPLEPIR